MTSRKFIAGILLGLSFLLSAGVEAKGANINLLSSSPVGSWQVREDITTDHKGRKTVTKIRTSMVGKEQRAGEQYYWIEMVVDSYKLSKKGKRKKKGDQAVVKSLVSKKALSDDPANAIYNLRGFGKEIIIQTGNSDPMIIREAGGFMAGVMKAMGTEIKYDFKDLGQEQVKVGAGEFTARKMQGKGSTEMKVIFKKIKVDSDTTSWMSNAIPFGIVKALGTSVTNGKTSTFSTELVEYGKSGATTVITKTPQEMPSLGGFGQQQ